MGAESTRDRRRTFSFTCPLRTGRSPHHARRPFFRVLFFIAVFFTLVSQASVVRGAVAPVGQIPTITVSVTPSAFALPILLVNDLAEWKDFGIQVHVKVSSGGAEQLDGASGNAWDVAVMDPLFAFRGGNEGDIAIVGVAGNLAGALSLLFRKGQTAPFPVKSEAGFTGRRFAVAVPSAEHFYLTASIQDHGIRAPQMPVTEPGGADPMRILSEGRAEVGLLREPFAQILLGKGWVQAEEFRKNRIFLPTCLVATASYADTRKTLVLRWLEGYSRGIRIIRKDPAKAAIRLRQFYRETLKEDIPETMLIREIQEIFYFDLQERERLFRAEAGKASPMESMARTLTAYLLHQKVITEAQESSTYLLAQLCDQLSALHGEADAQLKKTEAAIRETEKVGAPVRAFWKTWEEARVQIDDGRGCLTVIGILSDLQRSAEQSRAETLRLVKFRRIEAGFGMLLLLYYGGYFLCWKRKKGS